MPVVAGTKSSKWDACRLKATRLEYCLRDNDYRLAVCVPEIIDLKECCMLHEVHLSACVRMRQPIRIVLYGVHGEQGKSTPANLQRLGHTQCPRRRCSRKPDNPNYILCKSCGCSELLYYT